MGKQDNSVNDKYGNRSVYIENISLFIIDI